MLNKDTWFDVWLDYFYDIGDEEIVERIHKPTPQDLYEALKLAKNLQFFGMHIVLRKGNWIVQVSPAIDDSELEDDDKYDKYLRENEADRIYIKIWNYPFSLSITLQDIDFRDYETESTYSDGVFMGDYLYRSLPFDEGVDFILQFYEHQRLKNYFRHLSHRSYKEFSRTSYQLDDEYVGVNFPDSDEISQIIEYLKSASLKRLYIRIQTKGYTEEDPYERMFRREHILMHPVENQPRVMITSFQRLSKNRIEKARIIDKSLYPSDEMVTVRFSDKLSEQIPLHQTIAIDDAIDFILKDFVNNHNFCYLGNWL